MARRESIHGQWSSRWVFILAATGSAVGLGNIWRFPYMAGENGGGAFVLVYLACVAFVGVPIMIAEVLIGRRGRRSPINAMRALAREEGLSRWWEGLGWMGIAAGFLILSFYSVVAGWAVAYIFHSLAGDFTAATVEVAGQQFDALTASAERMLGWHTVFMVMTGVVVARGVRSGLEQAVKYLMPALFVMLLVMVGYALGNGRFTEALAYLFQPDFGKLTPGVVLSAVGQAFFSLSLGMGAIMIYGSYLPARASIPQTAYWIAAADTAVALLAGLAIFPIVFAFGMQPEAGPGLVFKTLTVAFGNMPGGAFFGAVFYTLLTVAAWTSSISLLEPAVAWLVEVRGMRRSRAALWAGTFAWLLGIGSLLSFNHWAGYTIAGRNFFDLVQLVSADIMLPVGGVLICIFAAWRMSEASRREELADMPSWAYQGWLLLVRYVAPTAVIVVFLNILDLLPVARHLAWVALAVVVLRALGQMPARRRR